MGNLDPAGAMREASRVYRAGRVPVRDTRAAFCLMPTRPHFFRPPTSRADPMGAGISRLRGRWRGSRSGTSTNNYSRLDTAR